MDAKDDEQNADTDTAASPIFPVPAAQRIKRDGMDFYTNTLGAPKYVVSVWLAQHDAMRKIALNQSSSSHFSPWFFFRFDYFLIENNNKKKKKLTLSLSSHTLYGV